MKEMLSELLNNAYAPISGKKIACVVKMKDGKLFTGVNVENPSFKSGLCAEQVAIGKAISSGYTKGTFDSIFIMDSDNTFIKPCFLCRQNFVEFFDKDVNIFALTLDGREEKYSMDEICPYPLGMED